MPDHLKNTQSLTHGVVLGGDLRVVDPLLSEVTPLVIAEEVGEGHYGGLQGVRASRPEIAVICGLQIFIKDTVIIPIIRASLPGP